MAMLLRKVGLSNGSPVIDYILTLLWFYYLTFLYVQARGQQLPGNRCWSLPRFGLAILLLSGFLAYTVTRSIIRPEGQT
jgi:cbb3-type cytochrome oxidase subunit 1